jgi:GNAT superfamily N-acetyltransferase
MFLILNATYLSMEQHRNGYTITTDARHFDLACIHGYLTQSYWAEGIPLEVVRRSIEHSLCFGIFHGEDQVGFARIISDYATYAYLADVFVLEEYRGKGLSKWLMECIVAHPDLQGLRRWMLATRDAHKLYEKYGFTPLAKPERYMERLDLDVYKREK